MFRELSPYRQEIVYRPQSYEPYQPDLTWVKRHPAFPWKPTVSLKDGVLYTLDWLKNNPPSSVLSPAPPPAQPNQPPAQTPAQSDPPRSPGVLPAPPPPKNLRPLQQFRRNRQVKQSAAAAAPRSRLKRWLFLALGGTLLGLVSLVVFVAAPLLFSWSAFTRIHQEVLAGDLVRAHRQASLAAGRLSAAASGLSVIGQLASPLGFDRYLYRLEKLTQINLNLSQAGVHLTRAFSDLFQAAEIILGRRQADPFQFLDSARVETTKAYELLSLVEALLQQKRPQLSKVQLFGIGKFYTLLQDSLPDLRQKLASLRQLLAVLPDFIGVNDQKKTYLLLLQNNAELRPTGGFIGSFGLVIFQNGKLLDFSVEDVYAADGQLKGHVEPPPLLKEHLGEANWYLRDVNWDPDFPTSARRAEWFLQKELGRQVDGTIGLNLYVAQNLLNAIGDITLPDYQETITAANLFERAQSHSEVDFFPGSTQKKDFLSSVIRHLYLRLANLTPDQAIAVSAALHDSLAQRQLLIAPASPQSAEIFRTLGWDGSLLPPPPCSRSGHCLGDYLAIREANVGVNKANLYLKRQINYDLNIFKETSLVSTVTLTYSNTSPADSWPGGAYKNYLRLYVPQGSTLKSVTVDSQSLPAAQIQVTSQHDKTVIGFLTKVAIKSQSVVKVSYQLPSGLDFSPASAQAQADYSLTFQKQPGTGADPLQITITHPAYLHPTVVSPAAAVKPQVISLTTNSSQNRSLDVTFTK